MKKKIKKEKSEPVNLNNQNNIKSGEVKEKIPRKFIITDFINKFKGKFKNILKPSVNIPDPNSKKSNNIGIIVLLIFIPFIVVVFMTVKPYYDNQRLIANNLDSNQNETKPLEVIIPEPVSITEDSLENYITLKKDSLLKLKVIDTAKLNSTNKCFYLLIDKSFIFCTTNADSLKINVIDESIIINGDRYSIFWVDLYVHEKFQNTTYIKTEKDSLNIKKGVFVRVEPEKLLYIYKDTVTDANKYKLAEGMKFKSKSKDNGIYIITFIGYKKQYNP